MGRNLAEIRGLMNQAHPPARACRRRPARRAQRARRRSRAPRRPGLSRAGKASTLGIARMEASLSRLEQGLQEKPRRRRVPDGRPPAGRRDAPSHVSQLEDDGRADGPPCDADQDRQVAQQDLLRLLAEIAPVHQEQVAEDAEDDERDRDHHRLRVARGERVEAVRDHGRRRDDGDELVDERERVALQHGPPGRRLRADEHELAAALCQREEEREQRGAEQEPRRDPHLHRRRSRRRADDEQPADRHHVEQHDVLERERVRRPEARRRCRGTGSTASPSGATSSTAEKSSTAASASAQPWRKLAARDRPRALDRMHAVVRRVADVVDEVARARRRAVRGEGGERLAPAGEVAELRREDDPGEEEQVLRPLPRPQRDERRAQPASARRGRLVDRCGLGQHHAGRRLVAVPDGQDELEAAALRPGWESSSMLPPSATASSCAIASPSPVPESSRDQNGRKIRSRSSARRPGRCRRPRPTRGRSTRRARAPPARRPASSERRSRAGWR